jgi:hypothetical protein
MDLTVGGPIMGVLRAHLGRAGEHRVLGPLEVDVGGDEGDEAVEVLGVVGFDVTRDRPAAEGTGDAPISDPENHPESHPTGTTLASAIGTYPPPCELRSVPLVTCTSKVAKAVGYRAGRSLARLGEPHAAGRRYCS